MGGIFSSRKKQNIISEESQFIFFSPKWLEEWVKSQHELQVLPVEDQQWPMEVAAGNAHVQCTARWLGQ